MEIPQHFKARPYQAEFLKNAPKARTIVLKWPRRAGKGLSCFAYAITRMVNEPMGVIMVYPTKEQGFRSFWNNVENDGFRTIEHVPKELLSVSKFTLQLSSDLKASGDAEISLKGIDAMNLRGDLIGEQPAKVDERLTNFLGFGREDVQLSDLAVPDLKDTSQPFVLKAHLQHTIADEGGPGEVLLNPWIGDPIRTPVFRSTQRQSFILFEGAKKDVASITFKLPSGIEVEKLPAEVNIQGDMADFSHACTQSGDIVSCTRTFTLKKAVQTDPKGYPSVKTFFDEVAKHDQEVILLRKQ